MYSLLGYPRGPHFDMSMCQGEPYMTQSTNLLYPIEQMGLRPNRELPQPSDEFFKRTTATSGRLQPLQPAVDVIIISYTNNQGTLTAAKEPRIITAELESPSPFKDVVWIIPSQPLHLNWSPSPEKRDSGDGRRRERYVLKKLSMIAPQKIKRMPSKANYSCLQVDPHCLLPYIPGSVGPPDIPNKATTNSTASTE